MAMSELPGAAIAAVQGMMANNKYAQIALAASIVILTLLLAFGIGVSIWREEPLSPIIVSILTFLLGSGSTLVGAQHGVTTAMQAVATQQIASMQTIQQTAKVANIAPADQTPAAQTVPTTNGQ